jgi:hypothetical protein
MWIIGLAWVYVVGLMALTETSIVAGVLTFVGYCVVPLALLWYIFFRPGMRRAARLRAARAAAPGPAAPLPAAPVPGETLPPAASRAGPAPVLPAGDA